MTGRSTIVAFGLLLCASISPPASPQSSMAGPPRQTSSGNEELPTRERPSGPHDVGRMSYYWIDSKRPDRFATGMHREVMVYLWYPASRRRSDVNGSYLPRAKELDAVPALQQRMRAEFGVHWSSIVSGAIASHAADGAPVIAKPARLPIVLFSHGNGSTTFNYASLLEDLASHGYIVAAIEHPHTAVAVRFPDGRIVPFHEPARTPALSRAERLQWMMKSASAAIAEGAADIVFVRERLAELNASHAPFAGRLAVNRVAAMGHSAGGAFATRACQLDSSLAACVNLDGGMPPVTVLPDYADGAAVKQPLLLLEPQQTESSIVGTKEEIEQYVLKKEQQLQSCAPGSYHVVLKSPGIAHPSFSDTPIFFAGKDGYPPIEAVRYNHRLIRSFVRAFLDKNLLGRKAPLLDSRRGAHPEASVKRYGR